METVGPYQAKPNRRHRIKSARKRAAKNVMKAKRNGKTLEHSPEGETEINTTTE